MIPPPGGTEPASLVLGYQSHIWQCLELSEPSGLCLIMLGAARADAEVGVCLRHVTYYLELELPRLKIQPHFRFRFYLYIHLRSRISSK